MNKKTIEKLIIMLITLAVMTITIYFSITDESLKDIIITLISLLAAVAVFIQIKQGTDIAKAEFVMGLQETFSNSKGFSELFMTCWNEYVNSENSNADKKNNKSHTNLESVKTFLNKDDGRKVLLNYLTFFESIYLMKEQGNLDFKILDELFGRRFFIVVTNKTIQEEDLCKNIAYYDNVKKLYDDWKNYRKKLINKNIKNNFKDYRKKYKILIKYCENYNKVITDYNYQKIITNYTDYKKIIEEEKFLIFEKHPLNEDLLITYSNKNSSKKNS